MSFALVNENVIPHIGWNLPIFVFLRRFLNYGWLLSWSRNTVQIDHKEFIINPQPYGYVFINSFRNQSVYLWYWKGKSVSVDAVPVRKIMNFYFVSAYTHVVFVSIFFDGKGVEIYTFLLLCNDNSSYVS